MEAPVFALVDAMFRLPAKLDRLLTSHGHMLPKGAEDEIPLIKQDLEKIIVILQGHGNSRADDSTMMVKCLVKEVRELSYDIEDSIDQYEHVADSWRGIVPRRKKKITRSSSKATRLPEKLKWRLWMANKIREFSVRSQEALQRYSLFNLGGISNTASTSTSGCDTSFGSGHPTQYGEHANHRVGIDAPMDKLEAWLAKDDMQKLKVVSIVGSGGVGKTTLANELYHRIGRQYECRAFVRMSRMPDVRRLLISMLSQVRPHQPPYTWKVHSLIADIRAHLQDKRYLIVIDEVWATSTWDIVHSALPDGNLCSGMLITTEIEDVALKCCAYDSKYVFMMKPFGDDDSSKLFFNTAFGPQHKCPPELSEVSNNIIRKCGGLPLATVTVASLLASRLRIPEQWDYVNKSLGYGLRRNPTSEGMTQILNLSYNNLPQHLKACLMYVSIYNEGYIIQKDDLVKQWIAEGFICATEEKDKEEISRSYFDELINSRMIQPVHINDNDDVLSCTVHHMVLDFITHKSIEENFVTTIDHSQTTASLADKVRRLSLQFGNAEATPPTNMRLSQVRTLAFFGVFKCVPSIAEFRLLQVLILHLWGDAEGISFDLTGISGLFRLRYLHVTCNVTLEVQQTQIRGLQYLETLKIEARVSAVPSNIVHLPGLLHLYLPVGTNLPNGIGHMTSLCTLGSFDLSGNSIDNVQSLGELTNLRALQLTCSVAPSGYLESKMDCMVSILTKLCNLRSLTLESSSFLEVGPSNVSISCDGLSSVSSPPALLRRFEWLPHICTFSSLPKWIRHLGELCILKIGVMELTRNDVDALGGLPALAVLSLYVRTKPAEQIVFNKTGFSVLKSFKFKSSVPWLKFQADAMPNLRKLKLGFDAHGADQYGITLPVGIEHLSGLKEISAKIGSGDGADDPYRSTAESALSRAIMMHPGRPCINIQHVDGMFGGKDDKKSRIQEEEHKRVQKQYEIMEEGILQKSSREDADIRLCAFSAWQNVADKQADIRARGLSAPRGLMAMWLMKTEMQKEEQRNLQQYVSTEEDSNKQHGVLQKDFSEYAYEHAYGREMLPKRRMQVRVSSVQEQEDDGFSWRKYGQKEILGTKYPRSYFRCTHRNSKGCLAIKQVQRTDGDPLLFDVVYVGNHTCNQGKHSLPQPVQEQSSTSVWVKADRSTQGLEQMPPRKTLAKGRQSPQAQVLYMQDGVAIDDGRSWRKYGQKEIIGHKFPRSYYRCAFSQDCTATKQEQRTDSDPLVCRVVYNGMHTCAGPSVQPRQEQSSVSVGATSSSSMSPATSGSQVTYETVSGSSGAGVRFMSPMTSGSQVTYEEVSGSTSGVRLRGGQVAYEVASNYLLDLNVPPPPWDEN